MEDLSPEQLEAILGTDYEIVLADILRQKEAAEGRRHEQKAVGQLPSGHVFFDPGGIAQNLIGQYRGKKDAEKAQQALDETLRKQKDGRRIYAEALQRKPPAPQPVAAPPQPAAAPTPAPTPVAMAPGAPPALANASQMPPDRLAGAGVPPDVQALLAKLRGQ